MQSLRRLVQRDSAINCEETRDAHARTHTQRDRTFNLFQLVARFVHLRSTIIQPDKAEAVTYVPVNEGQCGGNRFSSISVKPRCATNMRIERANFGYISLRNVVIMNNRQRLISIRLALIYLYNYTYKF